MTKLSALQRCFEGWIPATMISCSGDGIPNVMHLSRVHQLDDDHVVLSRQFFNKTARNIAANPKVMILLTDPLDWQNYRLEARFVRAETEGATFERLSAAVDAVAAATGMKDVFKLQSADVFRVTRIEKVPDCVIDETFGHSAG